MGARDAKEPRFLVTLLQLFQLAYAKQTLNASRERTPPAINDSYGHSGLQRLRPKPSWLALSPHPSLLSPTFPGFPRGALGEVRSCCKPSWLGRWCCF